VRGIAGGEEISRPQNPEIICRTDRGPILINHTHFTSAPKREGGGGEESIHLCVPYFTTCTCVQQSDSVAAERLTFDAVLSNIYAGICIEITTK
jgi:hypothetical protein